jgi:hypothetical protein
MLFCYSALLADATGYVGLGGVMGIDSVTLTNPGEAAQHTTANLQAVQIKAGYGNVHGYGIEFDVGYGYYDKNIFSVQDKSYTYFDLSMIKAFDFGVGFYPFLKLGYGTGTLEVKRALTNSVYSGTFFAGVGAYIPVAYGFDVEASVIYGSQSWEGLNMIGSEVVTNSTVVVPYLGLNYRF